MLLAFVACSQRLRRYLGVVECIGGEDATTVLVDERLSGSEGGGEGPFDCLNQTTRHWYTGSVYKCAVPSYSGHQVYESHVD